MSRTESKVKRREGEERELESWGGRWLIVEWESESLGNWTGRSEQENHKAISSFFRLFFSLNEPHTPAATGTVVRFLLCKVSVKNAFQKASRALME